MRVLFIAHRFPPQSGGGVIRPVKFAKYLSRLGVQVTVLTADSPAGSRQDASLLQDLPSDVKVINVPEKPSIPPLVNGRIRGRLRVARRWALYQCVVPDDRAGFIAPAIRAASDLGKNQFDVVLATGGPWSAFVAAEKIAGLLSLPLVLDYRDPWTTFFSGAPRGSGLLARWRNPGLERHIVSRARAIVSVHESVPAIMETGLRVPGLAARCRWIPNGYDPEDFEGLTPTSSRQFVITYVGSLYGTRSLRAVADALETLVRSGEVAAEDLLFRVLGPSDTRIANQLAGSSISDRVDAPGLVPHREALSALAGSTVNLLVDLVYDGPNVHTPGKLYEYLRAGRPILSISREGTTPALIREARAGWVVPPDDPDALGAVLKRAYEDWRQHRALPIPDPAVVGRFDRSRLAVELQQVLTACTSSATQ
jgi:glycosyltransferase involved in cell wall biosynthesis